MQLKIEIYGAKFDRTEGRNNSTIVIGYLETSILTMNKTII